LFRLQDGGVFVTGPGDTLDFAVASSAGVKLLIIADRNPGAQQLLQSLSISAA
jgi:hypothetical protein